MRKSYQNSLYSFCFAGVLTGLLMLTGWVNRLAVKSQQQGGMGIPMDQELVLPEAAFQKKAAYSWQRSDTSIALLQDKKVVWGFNFNRSYDKPYFFPLRVAGKEEDLVWKRPADHLWHRGLWFSWKLINGVNYWEENEETRLSDGRSKITDVQINQHKDFSATIRLKMSYAPEGKKSVLLEDRTLFVSAPDDSGNYYIDWDLRFRAGNEEVVLDRTPPESQGGPYYGGYAGLSYRAAQGMDHPLFRDSEGWQDSSELIGHGKRAHWMDLSGRIDSTTQSWAGVTTFSHPENPNSPTPWYLYKEKDFAFYNASFLFDQPLKIEPKEELRLLYRVFVHNNRAEEHLLRKQFEDFLKKGVNQK